MSALHQELMSGEALHALNSGTTLPSLRMAMFETQHGCILGALVEITRVE